MTPEQLKVVAAHVQDIKRMKANLLSAFVDVEADAAVNCAERRLCRILNSYSPVCALPPEVLSHIFKLGQEMEREEFGDDDEAISEDALSVYGPFEVSVSHVSSHFRNVAVGTCLLWSDITITPALSGAEIATYIARSDSCGLGVRIDLGGVRTPNPLTMAKTGMVIPHLHRSHRLAIDSIRESVAWPIIRCLCNVATPILQHLSLSVDEVEGFNMNNAEVLQGGAPYLSFVRLRGVALPLFCPPLTKVTTLHLDQTTALPILYTTFRAILTAPTLLTNLSIYGDIITAHTTAWPGISNPISLPHLRCLRICGVGGTIYSGLLLGITAPALESLVLKDLKEHDLEGFWASSVHALRFPFLRSLTFLDSEVSKDVYKEMFYGFPAISSFTAAHYTTTPAMLLLLSEPQTVVGDIPWPRLRTLTLLVNLHGFEQLIVDVVKQRKAVGCPVKTLRLGMAQPLSALSQYTWLQENVTLERLVDFDGWPRANADFHADPDDILFS